jgi:hypothetical protein
MRKLTIVCVFLAIALVAVSSSYITALVLLPNYKGNTAMEPQTSITNNPTQAPAPTAAPAPTKTDVAPADGGIYVYEFIPKPEYNSTYIVNSLFDAQKCYDITIQPNWVQVAYYNPASAALQGNMTLLCDSRGVQTYTCHVDADTISAYDMYTSLRIAGHATAPYPPGGSGLPGYGERVQW